MVGLCKWSGAFFQAQELPRDSAGNGLSGRRVKGQARLDACKSEKAGSNSEEEEDGEEAGSGSSGGGAGTKKEEASNEEYQDACPSTGQADGWRHSKSVRGEPVLASLSADECRGSEDMNTSKPRAGGAGGRRPIHRGKTFSKVERDPRIHAWLTAPALCIPAPLTRPP